MIKAEGPFDWERHFVSERRRLHVLKGDAGPLDTLKFPRPQTYRKTDPSKVVKGLARILKGS